MIPTGFQLRAGHELLGMSQANLATAVRVGLAVVVRAELAVHMPMLTRRNSAASQGALEAAGVEFLNQVSTGTHLRKELLSSVE